VGTIGNRMHRKPKSQKSHTYTYGQWARPKGMAKKKVKRWPQGLEHDKLPCGKRQRGRKGMKKIKSHKKDRPTQKSSSEPIQIRKSSR